MVAPSSAGLSPLDQLEDELAAGPVTVARYMDLSNRHYYATRDPLGTAGDFVTAPEISQMFGELIGLWCAELWTRLRCPTPVRLVELGPGRGTLMADARRAIGQVLPACAAALDVHLVETSPALRARQAERLGDGVAWHADLGTVPPGAMLLIANEMLDALPVHQLVRTEHGWCERLVERFEGALRFAVAAEPSALAAALDPTVASAPPGSVAELPQPAADLVAGVAARVKAGGAALFIDYGYARPAAGESLQAVRRHRSQPVLAAPGEADLTVHVDFARMAAAAGAAGARTWGPVPQGRFLERLGIIVRAERLARDPAAAPAVRAALRRLVEPSQMGLLFQVLAVTDPALDAVPGFA